MHAFRSSPSARTRATLSHMKRFAAFLLAGSVCLLSALAQKTTSPFVGRWDFNTGAQRANWLGVTEKDGTLEIWFQPTGGNVRQIKEFKVEGSHLTLTIDRANQKNPGMIWELDPAGDKLTGVQKRGTNELALTGMRAPELKRNPPAAWTDPEPLFNGKDLTGWEPTDPAQNHWTVENGELVNQAHGANLRGVRKFDDFKVHVEFNCPDDGNSGFYLRGRYEVQIEYEPLEKNPPERRIGSIYGFLTPAVTVPRKPGTWESFDITLVGRTVTIIHDGVLTIDRKEIPGITGGALDANEGEPGTFYIQGDHTGGLRFRNIRISVPKH
jgi:hypothetical protein